MSLNSNHSMVHARMQKKHADEPLVLSLPPSTPPFFYGGGGGVYFFSFFFPSFFVVSLFFFFSLPTPKGGATETWGQSVVWTGRRYHCGMPINQSNVRVDRNVTGGRRGGQTRTFCADHPVLSSSYTHTHTLLLLVTGHKV